MIRALVSLFLLPVATFAAEPALSASFGEVDISPVLAPKSPVFLAGFGLNRKATSQHDPIMARVVVLGDGTKTIALVSVDTVGLFLPTVEAIRKRLPGFAHVLVSATHNHDGPDTLGLWGSSPVSTGVDPAYMAKLEDGIVDCVKRTAKTLAPAVAEIGTASDATLLHDSREPYVLHEELVVLRFRSPTTKANLGILVQWNCHPELLGSRNTEISADHVGYTVAALSKTHQCPVAYFSGTVGGLLSANGLPLKSAAGVALQDGTHEKTKLYGELVAGLADKALAKSGPISLVPLEVRTKSLLLPVENGLYKFASQVGTLKRTMYEWHGTPTPDRLIETKEITRPIAVRSEVGYLKLGDLEVAVIPGEIYPELVLGKVQDPPDAGADYPDAPIEPAIYAQLKGKHKMIIGLGNDEIGYIIPKRQWDEKPPYSYGRKKAQYGEMNSIGPDAAPLICGKFRDLAAGKR